MNPFYRRPGAVYSDGKCVFTVWAPLKEKVILKIIYPNEVLHSMQCDAWGYWTVVLDNIEVGTRYVYLLDDTLERPDPASVSQPDGVHGASEVFYADFNWSDSEWKGKSLDEIIIYEIHTGAFTVAGTFDAITDKLDYLNDLGINAIELMPIAQFPGECNWGYDGVYPFAIHSCYGDISSFKKLVDAAHNRGIAVILDVVYNHMGPDGSYLCDFAPYFTDRYKTPWGDALNFDGPYCDGVRNYFIQNAIRWLDEFHIDGLRMDAVHAMWDYSAVHIMQELSEHVRALETQTGRKKILIAELDLNNTRYINPKEKGGYGLDGQWIDEFHHALHSLLTGETDGYYSDFGALEHLEKAFKNTYVYNGTYSPHRKKFFGMQVEDNPYSQFVVFSQNHDHIGNRPVGDRLSTNISFEALKLGAAVVLLSPYVPLIFMGEEYGEKNPFLYFVDHQDETLAKNVSEGRKKEFSYFDFKDDYPDPQDKDVFMRSKLSWEYSEGSENGILHTLYKHLILFRKSHPCLINKGRDSIQVQRIGENILIIDRIHNAHHIRIFFNFGKENQCVYNQGFQYKKVLDTSDVIWHGSGGSAPAHIETNTSVSLNPLSAVVYEKVCMENRE